MKKENTIETVKEVKEVGEDNKAEAIVPEEKKESKAKAFVEKLGAGVKKYGKTALGVVIVGGGLLAAYALGKGHSGDDYDSDYGYSRDNEDEAVDVEYTETTVE